MKGESTRSYLQRIDIESNHQLLASQKKLFKKSEKQKQLSYTFAKHTQYALIIGILK